MKDNSAFGDFVFVKCLLINICALFVFGCGTTKWSDTSRTGTEQLLISNAIDRVVNTIDFSPMKNKKCYLNSSAISQAPDHDYLSMTIRQHLISAGAVLLSKEEDADYIVELRAGAVGTDRDEVLWGIPAMTMPAIPGASYSGTTIPEIPFIKRTKQRGVAKIALFAYNKATGKAFWASGNSQGESTAKNLWFAGAGPLTRGTIYHETTFAGNPVPLTSKTDEGAMFERSQIFSEAAQSPTIPVPLAPQIPVPPTNTPKY